MRIFILFLVFVSSSDGLFAQWSLDFETGACWNASNNIKAPNTTEASRFSLTDNTNASAFPYFRLETTYTLSKKHTFRALYAPLTTLVNGEFLQSTLFEGEEFLGKFTGVYTFNSIRLSYRYNFDSDGKFKWGLGVTGKLRDAKIEIIGDGKREQTTDLGFVPLVHFNATYTFASNFDLWLNGDALAVPGTPGRAEDATLALRFMHHHGIFHLGYRILEGGADVEQVYNFSLFHYAAVGYTATF